MFCGMLKACQANRINQASTEYPFLTKKQAHFLLRLVLLRYRASYCSKLYGPSI